MFARGPLLSLVAGVVLLAAGTSTAVGAPTVSGLTASDITSTSVTLNGSVSSSITLYYHVEYGTTTSYGSSAPDPEVQKDPYVCPTASTSAATPDYDPPWMRCAGGETAYDSFTVPLSALQPGTTYHARLVAHDANGTSDGPDSTFTTAPSGPSPVEVAPPSLSGKAIVGGTLTCAPGSWSGAASIVIAWLRDGVVIPYETDGTYVPGAADDGAQIACSVTASSPGETDGTAQTAAVLIGHEPLHVALLTRTAAVRRGKVYVRISCLDRYEPCRTTLGFTLRRRGRKQPEALGHAPVVLPPGASGRFTVTLDRAGRRALAAALGHRMVVTATLGTTRRRLTLAG